MNQKTTFLTALVLAAGALTASVTGCELIASVDRSKISGTGGTGGAGTGGTGGMPSTSTGMGGMTTSTGGMGGTGGMTTSTGTGGTCGGGTTCSAPADCGTPANECVLNTCDMGCCGTTNAADDTPLANQTTGNCQAEVCKSGAPGMKVDDTDKPTAMDDCHVGTCSNGTPGQDPKATGTACTSNGGKVCGDTSGANAGKCVGCNADADCAGDPNGKTRCDTTASVCVAPSCMDGVKDGAETDKDCGGGAASGCAACADGLHCGVGTDCTSGVCTGGVCQTPSCTDNTKNQGETGKDCGGSASAMPAGCAARCPVGEGCNSPSDCTTGACSGGLCVTKTNGLACSVNSDCTSGNCVDGVCCNNACTGTCNACTAAKKGGGGDGTCGPIAAGNDPDNECTDQGAASCGTTGVCDGAGACAKYSATTSCAAASCSGTTYTAASLCSGTGTCVAGATTDCSANGKVCNATAGCVDCNVDADCLATNDAGTLTCNTATHTCQ